MLKQFYQFIGIYTMQAYAGLLMGYAVINFAMKNILLNEKQKFVDTDLLEVLKKIQTTVNEALDE